MSDTNINSTSSDDLEFNLRFAIQSLPDKKIRCPSSWTVLQLKQFLYEDCSSKPEVEKQRLIYAGHCLKNEQVLKDIFNRNVEGITNDNSATQVVHLVCSSPEQIKAAKQLNNSEGLRNRQQPSSSGFTSNTAGFVPIEEPTFADVPQDANQAYAQAYHSYLRNYYSQNQQFGGLQFSMGTQNQIAVMGGLRNIAANPIPAPENNAVHVEQNDHPDFLDLIYKLVRFAFLAAIVFYSSMDRIIFVVAVICLMWLVQMRRERDNRNGAQNQNQNERVENANPEPAQNPQPPNPNNENNANDNNNNQIPGVPPQVENRQSAWNVFWSTVISFFSSLIPEPIPMNVN